MGEPDNSGAYKPEFNFYVELGETVLPMAKGMASGLGSSLAKFEIKGSSFNGFTSANFLPGKGTLKLPEGCENFGKKPICGFVNFEGLDMSNFDLSGKERYIQLFKYLSFEMDSNGGLLHLEVRNKKKNALKVIVDEAFQDLKEQINS
jgi:hypothetical protein